MRAAHCTSTGWLLRLCLSPLMALPAWADPQSITVLTTAGLPHPWAAVSVVVKGASAKGHGVVVDMGQRNRSFSPPVVIVPVGGAVNFPNYDTVRHHVYSFSPTKKFEIKLYTGTPTAPVVFDQPGTATLGCNIHDTMVGYIHVVDTPHHGVTDSQGKVTIDLPPGEHRLRVWTANMGEGAAPQEFPLKTGSPVTVKVKH